MSSRKTPRREYTELGTFELTGTVMRVTDPTYEKDCWANNILKGCKPGTWRGILSYMDCEGWGNRVHILAALEKGYDAPLTTLDNIRTTADGLYVTCGRAKGWEFAHFEPNAYSKPNVIDCNAGVDSATMCIFDDAAFQDMSVYADEDYEPTAEDWPDFVYSAVDGGLGGDVLYGGVVSSSGIGDGVYPCFVHKDDQGIIDGVAVLFL